MAITLDTYTMVKPGIRTSIARALERRSRKGPAKEKESVDTYLRKYRVAARLLHKSQVTSPGLPSPPCIFPAKWRFF
jgi:hypothetical protein